nr:MAG TPA: hypothetical protein [Caudoviricetes sp.]
MPDVLRWNIRRGTTVALLPGGALTQRRPQAQRRSRW